MSKIDFLGKKISGRFTVPSGIVGTEISVLKRLSQIEEVGVLTTKSISWEKREGNREPIIAQLEPGTFINAVGLANPGAEEFRKRLEAWNIPNDKFLLVSIVGKDEEEFMKVAEVLKDKTDGFEINVSCPHGGERGQTVGQDFDLVKRITAKISGLGKPVVVKISPNLDLKKSIVAAISGGAKAIAAINTVGPEESKILLNGKGGVSGKRVLEKGLEVVREIRQISKEVLIIASGGISTGNHVQRYLESGANILSVGSALAGMNSNEIKEYFKRLERDVLEKKDLAKELIKKDLVMEYQEMRVEENRQISQDLFWLKMNKPFRAAPGQFIMLFIPKIGEKPFSFYNRSGENLEIFYQKKGCFTTKMTELVSGEKLLIRGPYGKEIKIAKEKKILFVAGGTGIAAAKAFFESYNSLVLMVGARSGNRLPNFNKWQGGGCIKIYTDDGSVGAKGMVTDEFKKIVESFVPDYILACGPEIMNQNLVAVLSDEELKKTYLMRETETKCGIGICGRCADKNGSRYCVDGYRAEGC